MKNMNWRHCALFDKVGAPLRNNQTMSWLFFLAIASGAPCFGQQVPDPNCTSQLDNPRYPQGDGPVVLVDSGHNNFHTIDGRYQCFAKLLRADGYQVKDSPWRFTDESFLEVLETARILVIANACGFTCDASSPAFTEDEVGVVRDWVRRGGSLLLIFDHPPFASVENLAAVFGIELSGAPVQGQDTFSTSAGTLNFNHFVTQGERPEEVIVSVLAFVGSAFRFAVPLPDEVSATDILSFGPSAFFSGNRGGSAQGWLQGATVSYGEGRVYVSGEAAMFTAQIILPGGMPIGFNAPGAERNQQYLLNIVHWFGNDCNRNGALDHEDILSGASQDLDRDGVPDECEPDCNSNKLPDGYEIATGSGRDCNMNGIPDECDIETGRSRDCNGNAIPDSCDVASETSNDCDRNGLPDECDIASGHSQDCNGNGIPDGCEARFPLALIDSPPGIEASVYLGPPDEVFAGLGNEAVTYDLTPAMVIDGEGSDFNVYEGYQESRTEFSAIDVLVSDDGNRFISVNSSMRLLLLSARVPGDEAFRKPSFGRSYDLAPSELQTARYIRIQGTGEGPAGGSNGFDLDAIGLIHADACISPGGLQRPGDANQDGDLDLSDAIWLLGHLFLGTDPALPCEGGTASDPGPGSLALVDVNGDGGIDISDAVSVLDFLFLGGKGHPLVTGCVPIAGCPDRCGQ